MDRSTVVERSRAGADAGPVLVRVLPPLPASAFAARQAVRDLLGDRGGRMSPVTLVTSELVANAVVHAGTAVELCLALEADGHSLRAEVSDGLAPGARPLHAGRRAGKAHTASGRGLIMVSKLSTRWGVRPEAGGKTVWAVVPLERGLPLD
ncbi:MAG: ATP-binding protein [Acidimicrobiales bacterium]